MRECLKGSLSHGLFSDIRAAHALSRPTGESRAECQARHPSHMQLRGEGTELVAADVTNREFKGAKERSERFHAKIASNQV